MGPSCDESSPYNKWVVVYPAAWGARSIIVIECFAPCEHSTGETYASSGPS